MSEANLKRLKIIVAKYISVFWGDFEYALAMCFTQQTGPKHRNLIGGCYHTIL